MKWGRGLTRLYVVLWVLWAVGYGYWQGAEIARRYEAVKEYREVPPFRGEIDSKNPDIFAERYFAKYVNDPDFLRYAERYSVIVVEGDEREEAWRKVHLLWLRWLALAVIIPAVALRVLLWIWAGFEHRPEAKA
jgi:hypothetical protein